MSRSITAGVLAGLASAFIGGAWQVFTRYSTTTAGFHAWELAALRYAIPALLLSPMLWRHAPAIRSCPPLALLGMVLGGGLPFGLLAIGGTRFAPAAHMGVLVAGASPLIAAALTRLVWRERLEGARAIGLCLVALSVSMLAWRVLGFDVRTWPGDAMFLSASLLWAVFTLSFHRSRLGPWEATALVNAASALALAVFGCIAGLEPAPHAWTEWLVAAIWQGLLAGMAGLALFMMAIAHLGAARAAAFGALAPAISAAGGWLWLGESLSAPEGAAVLCTSVGVALASGAVRLSQLTRSSPAPSAADTSARASRGSR